MKNKILYTYLHNHIGIRQVFIFYVTDFKFVTHIPNLKKVNWSIFFQSDSFGQVVQYSLVVLTQKLTSKQGSYQVGINRQCCHFNICQWKVDPAIIEELSVTSLNIIKPTNQTSKDRGLNLTKKIYSWRINQLLLEIEKTKVSYCIILISPL